MFTPSSTIPIELRYCSIFAIDILQALLITVIVNILYVKNRFVNFYVVVYLLSALFLLLGLANFLSYSELRTPITINTIKTSIGWIVSDPSVVEPFILQIDLTKRVLLSIAIALTWASVPVWVAWLNWSRARNHGLFYRIGLSGFFAAAVIPVAGLGVIALQTSNVNAGPVPIVGFAIISVFSILLPNLCFKTFVRHPNWPLQNKRALGLVATGVGVLAVSLLGLGALGSGTAAIATTSHWGHLVSSIATADDVDYWNMAAPNLEELRRRYDTVAFPIGRNTREIASHEIPKERRIRRHIVIVSLETAFQEHYQLIDQPNLKTFYRMGQNAAVSQLHHTTTPFTNVAARSILSGLYLKPLGNVYFSADSLPSILDGFEYESTYIDSYRVDWSGGSVNRENLQAFKFDNVWEWRNASHAPLATLSRFEVALAREKEAFDKALRAVVKADSEGTYAFVFVQSGLGHFPWVVRDGKEGLSAKERIDELILEMDDLMASFIAGMTDSGIADEIILIITGDHGLRYSQEFQSLGLRYSHSHWAFNVPLMIHAPALFEQQVHLESVSSHVDIAPTVLYLIGVPTDSYYFHGESLFARDPRHRITFLLNTGLSLVSGFNYDGNHYTYDELTGTTHLSGNNTGSPSNTHNGGTIPITHDQELVDDTDEILAEMQRVMDQTIAYFIQRSELPDNQDDAGAFSLLEK